MKTTRINKTILVQKCLGLAMLATSLIALHLAVTSPVVEDVTALFFTIPVGAYLTITKKKILDI